VEVLGVRRISLILVFLVSLLGYSVQGVALPMVKPSDNVFIYEITEQLELAKDQEALKLIPQLNFNARIHVVFGVFQEIENRLSRLGWKRCQGNPFYSADSILGFNLYLKSEKCFFSPIEYAYLWLPEFAKADPEIQSVFFAAIEKLRRNLAKIDPAASRD